MTLTEYRSAQPAGSDGFAQLVRAEWTKFRSVRGWIIGMVIALLLMLAVGLAGVQNGGGCSSGANAPVQHGAACGVPVFPVGPGGAPVTDNFYFVRQPLTGDGSITVRVTSLTADHPGPGGVGQLPKPAGASGWGPQPWSKAGIIIKQSTKQGSAYAAMMVTGGNGVRMQYDYTQDVAGMAGSVSAAHPRWLRLTRSGDTITGYDSADGSDWIKVGAANLAGLSRGVQVGLFATSPDQVSTSTSFGSGSGYSDPTLATGVLDHVGVSGRHRGTWTGGIIGPAPTTFGPNGQSVVGFRQTGGRFTVTGSGDIAPLTAALGSGGGTAAIGEHLVGTFAGLIAVVVIATMFMTSEYRRGLIRVSLTASPRRGRVLAAKAVVIGLVTFALGLIAAIITVPLGVHLSQEQGEYVIPVSWLTEARVMIGTAALLGVAAVLTLAVGTILRRSAPTITAVIVGIVLVYILGIGPGLLPSGAGQWLLRLTPAAGFAIQQSLPKWPQIATVYQPPDYYPLAPWTGFAVLCGYAVLAMGLALFLLRRRDA
jgi:ABC-type transport system involved in multi-copper enzyme maturation permease subunit